MEAMTVPTPKVVVVYAGRDITKDITNALIEVSYTDFMEGESDTLELVLEDVDRRWQNAWYPQHGDVVNLQMGYADGPLLPCGDFEVDEVELDGPPDVVRIKALSAGVKRSVRTYNGRSYENTTLLQIAKDVAQRNKLTQKLKIEHVAIRYVAQAFEDDLGFLARLFAQYGYASTVRGSVLTVVKRTDLKAGKPVMVIARTDVSSYRFRDKVHGIFKDSQANYHDPRTKTLMKGKRVDPAAKRNRSSADTLKINVRAENDQQASLKADAALDRANEDQTGASLSMPGNVRLMAGVNVQLTDFGHMDGKYTITKGGHRFSRSAGYASEIDLKRVRDPSQGAKK